MLLKVQKSSDIYVNNYINPAYKDTFESLVDGHLFFKSDAYIVVGGQLFPNVFTDLYQFRKVEPEKRLGNNIRINHKLVEKLKKFGFKPIEVPGGGYPIHYSDEVVFLDFNDYKAKYFVISKYDPLLYTDDQLLKAETSADVIGRALEPYGNGFMDDGEFIKITFISKDHSKFSVMYPFRKTDLHWHGWKDGENVPCNAPETEIKSLSKCKAGKIHPSQHYRIKKTYKPLMGGYMAYLMPNPDLATETRNHSGWSSLFMSSNNDGISPIRIAHSRKIILEAYDIEDNILPTSYTYDVKTGKVIKQRHV